ncbi:MAG: hypothetical protein H0X66_12425 [Verrucomicrobia bacterium]|nr:hypothetical protein [Verrucomicrobiota bacterium]
MTSIFQQHYNFVINREAWVMNKRCLWRNIVARNFSLNSSRLSADRGT